jgi:hypothetical protein
MRTMGNVTFTGRMRMKKNYQKIDLSTIGDGAAGELFNEELSKVLANIEDVNTLATKPRTITLTITFTPDLDRETAEVIIASKTGLVAITPARSKITVSRDKGKLAAFEARPDGEAPANVSKIGY